MDHLSSSGSASPNGHPSSESAASEWLPIETAPLSTHWVKTRILLWVDDANCHAFGHFYDWPDLPARAVAEGYNGDWRITHWAPLPESPRKASAVIDDRSAADANSAGEVNQ